MGGEQNLGFGLVGVSVSSASPSLMRYFSSNISYYKDTSVEHWDDKERRRWDDKERRHWNDIVGLGDTVIK
ncbi:MAG: hypothetical protein LBK93_01105, partial [Rickettsiales bacterium]|jgi:hypothetical protein|nr:hypothetical protein [Rickettsiales bacterium]